MWGDTNRFLLRIPETIRTRKRTICERIAPVELSFHQTFSGVLRAAQARLFVFDFADLAVNLVARGIGKRVKKNLKAFGLAKLAGEGRWMGTEYNVPCAIYFLFIPKMGTSSIISS